jgi:hypothetical protein
MWILYLYLIVAGQTVAFNSQEYANFESCVAALHQLAPAGSDFAGQCVAKNERSAR